MLIDLIFRGKQSKVDLTFLVELLANRKEARFDSPENVQFEDCNDVKNIISSVDYVDFVITTDNCNIDKQVVKDVFINLGLLDGEFELLFFFDLNDLNRSVAEKLNADYLRVWSEKFKNNYSFESFVCQMDNGNEKEYYFDSNGLSPLYTKLR
jgi:hypothetical protein